MSTLFRPPIITRIWALSAAVAVGAQAAVAAVPLNLIGQDKFPTGVGRGPVYVYPNPSWAKVEQRGGEAGRSEGQVWSNRLLDLLKSRDTFFAGPGAGPDYDWPNPRGAIPGIALRTHIDPLKLNLAGKDTFFSGPGMGPDYDYPNPRGAIPAISLRTHVDAYKVNLDGKDKFFRGPGQGPAYDYPNPRAAQRATVYEVSGQDLLGTLLLFIQKPFNLTDYPNPRGAAFPSDLRTFTDRLKIQLAGKDAFFGLAGNPTFDWPVPMGRPRQPQPAPDQLLTLFAVLAAPFHLLDWPNPATADRRGMAVRAWNETWQNIATIRTVPAAAQYDWPVPKAAAYPQDLRSFYPTPFVWQRDLGTIIDTDMLQKPVNVVMAGDVPIKASWREQDVRPANFKTTTTVTATPARRLKGGKPSFTVKTDKRGYD